MIELALGIIEAEQQGAHFLAARAITEAANNAVGRALQLHLEHGPDVRLVSTVELLRHDTVKHMARLFEPFHGLAPVAGVGRKLEALEGAGSCEELLERRKPQSKRLLQEALAFG